MVGALLVAAFYITQSGLPNFPRFSVPSVCSDAPLVVLASNEKSGLIGEMAADFVEEWADDRRPVRRREGRAEGVGRG